MRHPQGQMIEIVFAVFEDRMDFEVASEWLNWDLLSLLAFVSGFCTFIEGIYWCL
jgi:hypothetical protein